MSEKCINITAVCHRIDGRGSDSGHIVKLFRGLNSIQIHSTDQSGIFLPICMKHTALHSLWPFVDRFCQQEKNYKNITSHNWHPETFCFPYIQLTSYLCLRALSDRRHGKGVESVSSASRSPQEIASNEGCVPSTWIPTIYRNKSTLEWNLIHVLITMAHGQDGASLKCKYNVIVVNRITEINGCTYSWCASTVRRFSSRRNAPRGTITYPKLTPFTITAHLKLMYLYVFIRATFIIVIIVIFTLLMRTYWSLLIPPAPSGHNERFEWINRSSWSAKHNRKAIKMRPEFSNEENKF